MLPEYEQREKSALQQGLEAKAGTGQKVSAQGLHSAHTGLATWVGRGLLVVPLVLLLSVCFAPRRRETSQLLSAAQHRRIILVDDVEHLPPLASKAIPMTLPNAGIVNIEVRVVRGNSIDAFLTTPDQFENPKKVEWNSLKIYRDIGTTGTKMFSWTGRLGQGGFYLVLRDMTVAIPTTPTSDISVKVLLDP